MVTNSSQTHPDKAHHHRYECNDPVIRVLVSAGEDLVSIDSFVQHNATACAYLASLSDTLNTPTPAPSPRPSLAHQGSFSTQLTLDQLLNGSATKAKVPAVYKTCLSECILGTTDFDAVLIGLSDLYEQVSWEIVLLAAVHVKQVQLVLWQVCSCTDIMIVLLSCPFCDMLPARHHYHVTTCSNRRHQLSKLA